MEPEIKRQLDEIHALAKDTHRLARAIRRHQLYGIVLTVLFWVVVIVTPFYIYQQYLAPLIEKFQVQNATGSPTTTQIEKLINSFKTGQ